MSCDNIDDCRTTSNIIWSCLATIFACTWVALHPNVPGKNVTDWRLLLQRCWLTVLALFAPEFIVLWALRQWLVARKFSKDTGLTMEYGFFLSMGGFVRTTDYGLRTVTPSSVTLSSSGQSRAIQSTISLPAPAFHSPSSSRTSFFGSDGITEVTLSPSSPLDAIRNVKVSELTDRSKGDIITKGFAVVQTTWFITQCIARAAQNLHVTELEVITVAFALMNLAVYALWWHKPLDVRHPITLGYDPKIRLACEKPEFSAQDFKPSFPARVRTAMFGGHNDADITNTVPILWSGWLDGVQFAIALEAASFVALVFGAIHCIAWSFVFPSITEQLLWRICSIIIVGVPGIYLVNLALVLCSPLVHIKAWNEVMIRILFVGAILYTLARGVLLVLPFLALRKLPPSAYETVDWLRFVPHL